VTITAPCPAGKRVTGGGYEEDRSAIFEVHKDAPTASQDGWEFRFARGTNQAFTVTVYAICATTS
jgi:hypothetical protein